MIPSFEEFLYPVLFLLRDGTPMKRDDLRIACALHMNFTNEELEERITSGKKYKIVDRLQWATYYLLKAGLLCRPSHAVDQITDEGKALLNKNITVINRKYLRENYPAFREFETQTRENAYRKLLDKKSVVETREAKILKQKKNKASKKATISNAYKEKQSIEQEKEQLQTLNLKDFETVLSTEDNLNKIKQTIEEITEGLANELKDIVNDFDNDSLKCLLLELFPKMGYSTVFEECDLKAQVSHDIAFSGFVNIDEMGLNRFFVLAQNKTKDEINPIDVQSFIGALSGMGINLGVYITTSSFATETYSYQKNGSVRCILIDGIALAKLMIKFNIGVVTRNIFEIKDVDQEFLFTRLTQSL